MINLHLVIGINYVSYYKTYIKSYILTQHNKKCHLRLMSRYSYSYGTGQLGKDLLRTVAGQASSIYFTYLLASGLCTLGSRTMDGFQRKPSKANTFS